MGAGRTACRSPPAVTLIHNYIYREVIALTAAIIGVLTFLFVSVEMFKVIEMIMYTDLSMWITVKFVLLLIPFTLTLTIPTGLLAAVLIVFGRMSSDRELLALKASGIGLAPIVTPVIFIAVFCSIVNFWLVASIVPKCREETNGMKHEIVTSNPMALLSPEVDIDKIPGLRLEFDKLENNELRHVFIWQLDDQSRVVSALRADRATVTLDLEHQVLLITLFNERGEQYPDPDDVSKVQPGVSAEQGSLAVSLNSFYEKVQRRLSWMTLPEIEQVIEAMQGAPTGELATPYLTEFQARISFAVACFTFVVVGLPLAIQTQRRETSIGVALTLVIVMVYWLLVTLGRALKAQAGLYPELIIWAPNFIFQAVGFWLFYRVNRK